MIQVMATGRDAKGHFIKGSKINQGRVPSVEQRQKQVAAMTGRVEPDEQKEKIRVAMVKAAAEGRLKIGIKGSVPWNKGMSRANGDPIPTYTYPELSEESKKHRSEARMGKHYSSNTEFKKGSKPWNTGKEWDEATLKKMSDAKKGKILTAEHIRKILTRRTPTSLEKKFQEIAEKNGLPYKFVGDGSFMIGRKNPDFINTNGEKIAIEVFSLYYKLRHAKTLEEWKDERQKVFGEYGWQIIFFDAMQVNEANILRELRVA